MTSPQRGWCEPSGKPLLHSPQAHPVPLLGLTLNEGLEKLPSEGQGPRLSGHRARHGCRVTETMCRVSPCVF